MNNAYDIVIIGAGPAGLALAQCISHLNKRILIIEKENVIGGCHAVRRVNGLFTEHGPRVYSSTYKVFQSLLNEMGVDFYDLFTKYNFSVSEIGGQTIFSTLSWFELVYLFKEFTMLMLNDNHGINVILKEFD
jgi:phytoene dehydrogenase-like protein